MRSNFSTATIVRFTPHEIRAVIIVLGVEPPSGWEYWKVPKGLE